ncbi:hypothetical protein AYO44_13715 [Planctomycetaceae bacterium SCGC AG-212-F19]|nr:hypothetical protein AYO44_13715 [Planctomycetaceae bacterium SCGC AG-212-F19]
MRWLLFAVSTAILLSSNNSQFLKEVSLQGGGDDVMDADTIETGLGARGAYQVGADVQMETWALFLFSHILSSHVRNLTTERSIPELTLGAQYHAQ